ncbi:unnamed protein product [Aphanomyces euteiches]|uniref:Fe2OG dioxygenase domain-containing protein n=1 Tax=Aphanomyces euteiches TaxID=100861 RepID=A0A6G0WY98_9STRA|nr:hypothetical protein Ae201684_010423 [Aphanomyces euteiches]KAH9132322.1 hypothetical protein AeRB84_021225 [Aphanomyces euteiches]
MGEEAPEMTAEEKQAVGSLEEKPHFRIRFYHAGKVVDSLLKLPLTMGPVDVDKGTQAVHLELWLKQQFAIAPDESVFAIVPVAEPYSPPLPLILLNTIAHRLVQECGDNVPILDYSLIIRPLSDLRQPIPLPSDESSPFFPIDGQALGSKKPTLARQQARIQFVTKMKEFGFARISVSREQAKIPIEAWEKVRTWLIQQLALPRADRWGERVDETDPESTDNQVEDDEEPTAPVSTLSSLVCFWRATPPVEKPRKLLVSRGRYVGFSCDPNREYLQMRRPLKHAGTVWPRPYFSTPEAAQFAQDMLQLFNVLDGIGHDCMEAICDVLAMDRSWIFNELLDDPSPPPTSADEVTNTDMSCRYGASVLRIYNYRNKKGENLDPKRLDINASCGSHADLGLVTVSPCATVPGLQMWNLDRMAWTDVECDATELHFSVFAGETLGVITNGLIRAPLHRVPATVVEDETKRRMSMPFFLRARPHACLNPNRPAGVAALTVRDFMEDMVFKTRPWRRESAATPDY